MIKKVMHCVECPFFTDYEENVCGLEQDKQFSDGFFYSTEPPISDDPIPVPDWCPLRKDSLTIALETDLSEYQKAAEELPKYSGGWRNLYWAERWEKFLHVDD